MKKDTHTFLPMPPRRSKRRRSRRSYKTVRRRSRSSKGIRKGRGTSRYRGEPQDEYARAIEYLRNLGEDSTETPPTFSDEFIKQVIEKLEPVIESIKAGVVGARESLIGHIAKLEAILQDKLKEEGKEEVQRKQDLLLNALSNQFDVWIPVNK